MLRTVTPEQAAQKLLEGAALVDVREADEHARERIPCARNLPLSKLAEVETALQAGRPVLFHCRSGSRTQGHAAGWPRRPAPARPMWSRAGWRPGSAPACQSP